jgi:hypothetical protein
MSESAPPCAKASVKISASPESVYALIADLPTLASLAEEANAMDWHKGDCVAVGNVFKGHNRAGSKKWTTTCTVTDVEPGRVFEFSVKSLAIPVALWRYDIEPADDGCVVTEQTWDRRPGWFRTPAGIATGVKDRPSVNAKNIELTLQRLKERAERG